MSAALTPVEEELLERFRTAVESTVRSGWARETVLSTAVIAARHFSVGERREVRVRLLEVAAELTGEPLVPLPQPDGSTAMAWPPARGEASKWMPYEDSAQLWAKVQQ